MQWFQKELTVQAVKLVRWIIVHTAFWKIRMHHRNRCAKNLKVLILVDFIQSFWPQSTKDTFLHWTRSQKLSFSITLAMHMHYQKHVYHSACLKPQMAFTNLTQTTTPLWMSPILWLQYWLKPTSNISGYMRLFFCLPWIPDTTPLVSHASLQCTPSLSPVASPFFAGR